MEFLLLIYMKTLPTELIVKIIGFLSFQIIVNLLLVTKEIYNIVIHHFLKSKKRVPKYKISQYNDYLILKKFDPRIKTLMIQGRFVNLENIYLVSVDYKRLYLKDVDISINNIKILDDIISWKCEKITFCKLVLPDKFVSSLECLEICKTIRFFHPIYNDCDEHNEYNFFKFVLDQLRIHKIVLSHWVLKDRHLFYLSIMNIVKLKKSLIRGDITKLDYVSHFYAIECRTWLSELGCYGSPESFEKKD